MKNQPSSERLRERAALRRQQMQDLLRVRHMAIKTEESYLAWFDRFTRFIEVRRPTGTATELVGAFLTQLAHQEVSAQTQNQALCALLFLYREVLKQDLGKINALWAKRGFREKMAPTVDEVHRLLKHTQDISGYPTRLIVHLLYGSGLRLGEGVGIRIKDLRLKDSKVVVREPKHGTDRIVTLPCSLIPGIQKQMERAKLLWESDRAKGLPVQLPGQLAKKYPSARFSWNWYWLFPQHQPCEHPRTGEKMRFHAHESSVQRCVRFAARAAGLDIMVSPHLLRHAWATHAKNAGENIRAIQKNLGHKSLETTMIYVHADATDVRSPLDRMLYQDCLSTPLGHVLAPG